MLVKTVCLRPYDVTDECHSYTFVGVREQQGMLNI